MCVGNCTRKISVAMMDRTFIFFSCLYMYAFEVFEGFVKCEYDFVVNTFEFSGWYVLPYVCAHQFICIVPILG